MKNGKIKYFIIALAAALIVGVVIASIAIDRMNSSVGDSTEAGATPVGTSEELTSPEESTSEAQTTESATDLQTTDKATAEAESTSGLVDTTKAPETTKVPDTTKEPDTTKVPDTTREPDTTKVPDTTREPETTAAPVTTSPPETAAPKPLETLIYNADKTPSETAPESVRLSFIGMGDNLIHTVIYEQAKKADGTYDFTSKYSGVADIVKNADIAFINQETPICQYYTVMGYPRFNSPVELSHNLVDLGFDVFGFANNHVADMGMKGIGTMISYFKKLDAMTVGLYANESDYNTIRIYETQGVRIAFLAYTYGTNMYGSRTQYLTYPQWMPVFTKERVTRQVTFAREVADIVIVSMHWGTENSFNVNTTQYEYAHLLADLGTDVILGTHPHVIQKIDILKGKNGNETVCYYSLGNGINAQSYFKNAVGIMASFDIVKDKDGARIENVKCIPTVSMLEKNYTNVRLLTLPDFTDELAALHCHNYTDRKITVQLVRDTLLANIRKEFLPDYVMDPDKVTTETQPDTTTPSETEPPASKKLTVCIDAGHQISGISEKEPNGPGSTVMKAKLTSGTQGVSSRVPEYQLNLDISLMLRDELIKRGYDVIMIRETNNCPMSNAERAVFANESGADIFIRIHANGSSNASVKGALCCAPTANNPYLTAENIDESRRLSQVVVDEFCKETGANNQGLYSVDTMTGINWCEIPVTIVEMGYMSNAEEDLLMTGNAEYRAKMVNGIANGIDKYFAK